MIFFWKKLSALTFVYTCFRNSILIGSHECRLQRPHKSYLMERDPSLFYSLHYLHELVWILGRILANQDVWTRKRRKGIGKRRRQASSKNSSWQHPRNHEASHPPSGASWWCKKNQWTDLRRNSRSPQSFPWKRDQRCCHIHWARQEEDCHRYGCRLCLETPRTHLVRIRRLNEVYSPPNGYLYSHTS